MLEESTQAVNHPKDCIWKKKNIKTVSARGFV
jgi:hypothetical protein